MSITTYIIYAAIVFAASTGTGLIVHFMGRPLSKGLFTLHKLLGLASLVLLILPIRLLIVENGIDSPAMIFLALTGISFITIFVTGGILSFEKPVNNVILNIHNFSPYAAILFAVISLILLQSKG